MLIKSFFAIGANAAALLIGYLTARDYKSGKLDKTDFQKIVEMSAKHLTGCSPPIYVWRVAKTEIQDLSV